MRLLVASFFAAHLTMAAASNPTFYKDVLPVLQKRCQECHRPGEVAPMSLLTYSEARPWAKSIRQAVASRKMPPWYADPHYGNFSNDRSLTQPEIDTLVAWVDRGAVEGSPKDAPAPRLFQEGWTIGKPDLVLNTGVDFKVPALGTIRYTYFVVPTGFTEDKWVKDLEVRPGNAAVVHHAVIFARPKGSKFVADAKPGEPFAEKEKSGFFGNQKRPPQNETGYLEGVMMRDYEMVGVYVPGGSAYRTLPGQARLVPAGSDLIFQMHYTANGKENVDRTRIGIVFAKEPPKERVLNAFIMNPTLTIPAGAPNHRVDAKLTLQSDVKLQALFPHMHLRGKAFEYTATYPTGETEMLLKVPRYDFNWQLTYFLDRQLLLPKGTQLRATAFYDNSPNNPANPDPAKEVYWGDQSWEEMIAGFVDLAIPVNIDPISLIRAEKPAPSTASNKQ